MPTEFVEVQIRPGMSEAVEARLLPGPGPGQPVVEAIPRLLQNLRFRQLRRPEKRPGTASGGTTGLPTAGSALWATEWSGLAAAGVQETLSSQPAGTAYLRDANSRWNLVGRHGLVVPERRFGIAQAQESAFSFRGASCVAINGVIYLAYSSSVTSINIVAIDPSGALLREATNQNAWKGRLVYDGTTLRLVYLPTGGSTTTLTIATVDTTTCIPTVAGTIGSTIVSAADYYDVAPLEGSSSWLIAYPEDATHIRVRVMSGITSTSSATITTTSQGTHVGISGQSGNKVVCTYIDGTAAEVCTFSDTLTGSSNVTVQTAAGSEAWGGQTSSVRVASGTWALVYPGSDSVSTPTLGVPMFYHARCNTAGTVTSAATKVYNALPCAKVFANGSGANYRATVLAATYTSSDDEAHYFLDLEPGAAAQVSGWSFEHVAKVDDTPIGSLHSECADLGNGRRFIPAFWQDPGLPYPLNGMDGLVFRISLASESMEWSGRRAIGATPGLLLSGGALYEHTSTQLNIFMGSPTHYVVENGFIAPPKIAVTSAAGGSLTSGREYTFCAVYVWTDPQGRIHRSAPSGTVTLTPSGGNLTATVRVSTLPASGRIGKASGSVVAEVYVAWNGGPFYRAGKTGSVEGSAISVTLSLGTEPSGSNAPLYTDNGILPTFPPSGARLLCMGGNRLFTVGWRETVVQFSKLYVPTAPWEFVDDDLFRVFIRQPITALGWMDGALVAFSKQRIWLVFGDGPDDRGVGQFTDPRELPATVGADSPHVVEVPQGLIYKGAGTLWLLPRGFGPPQPVGDDIQETLASFPYLRGAARCANGDDDCTHFVLAASDLPAAETKIAVWDNRLAAWSLDDIAGEVGAAGVVDGQFTWLLPSWSSANDVPARQFSTGSTQDLSSAGAATWIESRIGFGDWRPFGVIGWGNVHRISVHQEAMGSCLAKLAVTVDHVSVGTYSIAYNAASGPVYAEHGLASIKGAAFRFDLFDAENSGKTAGMVFHALALEVTREPQGAKRLDAAGRFT